MNDFICVYVPKAYAQIAKKIIEEAMNSVVFGVPITATAVISEGLATQ